MSKEYEQTALMRLIRMEVIGAGLEIKRPSMQGDPRMDVDAAPGFDAGDSMLAGSTVKGKSLRAGLKIGFGI